MKDALTVQHEVNQRSELLDKKGMSNEPETIEQVFYRCTSTDFSSRDREEIFRAMQEYADLQVKETKQTILDYLHTNQNDCLDDGEYKAFEKVFEFIENLGKKLK